MNIEKFKEQYNHLRDVDKVNVDDLCDHPNHIQSDQQIAKGPAKRNILKHSGREFICRTCHMKYDNPMNSPKKANRQTDDLVMVHCPCSDHEGESTRLMKLSCYYGEMKEPYLQTCKSCAQRGKIISEDQREKIRLALKDVPKSQEFKDKIVKYWQEHPERQSQAIETLLANRCTTGMLGKQHSEETKQKMSEAHKNKSFTKEHRENISKGRKKKIKEMGGFTREHRENLSKATSRNYEKGFDPTKYHRKGWHTSSKAGEVFYQSSYEKRAFILLDRDNDVKTYKVEEIRLPYFNPIKKITGLYLVDLNVEYMDGSQKLIEVKPAAWLQDEIVLAKHTAAMEYAEKQGMIFGVWTETNLFGPVYNPKRIKQFAESLDSPERKTKAKESARKKAQKYYKENIAKDKVAVYCEYCEEIHEVLKISYKDNVNKNGRYICIKENGQLQGKKPCEHKGNPYAAEGKKKCNGPCSQILPLDHFGKDKSRSDGYASRCKECRAKAELEKYYKKKTKKS